MLNFLDFIAYVTSTWIDFVERHLPTVLLRPLQQHDILWMASIIKIQRGRREPGTGNSKNRDGTGPCNENFRGESQILFTVVPGGKKTMLHHFCWDMKILAMKNSPNCFAPPSPNSFSSTSKFVRCHQRYNTDSTSCCGICPLKISLGSKIRGSSLRAAPLVIFTQAHQCRLWPFHGRVWIVPAYQAARRFFPSHAIRMFLLQVSLNPV